MIARKSKLESVLLSLVNAGVIKAKVSGDSKAQVSNIGFTDIKTSNELKFYQGNDGEFVMEVYLPSYLKTHFNDKHEIISTDGIDENLIKILGFRIPTQGLNSIEVIKVKGFLPSHLGNAIVVPKEITAKSGSDFDIDKLNLYFPAHYSRNGKSVYIKPHINDELLRKDYENYIEASVEFDENYEERVNKLRGKRMTFSAYKILAIDNAILSKHIEIIQHPANKIEFLTPTTDYDIKGHAKGQSDSIYPDETSVRGLRGESNIENKNNYIDTFYLINRKRSFETGKNTLGQFALHSTNHILAQQANLKLSDNYLKNNAPNFKGWKGGGLDLIYDMKGNLISKSIEQYENAAVDVEKDDYLLDLNVNEDSAGIFMYLIRLGVPMQEVNYFMSQPAITDYYTNYYNALADSTKIVSKSKAAKTAISVVQKKYGISKNQKFDINDLKRNIKFADYNYQAGVFSEFLKYEKGSKILNSFINITNFDTKAAGTSFTATDIIQYNFNNFDNVNVVKIDKKAIKVLENTDRFFERDGVQTFTGYFKDVVFDANKLFASLYQVNDYMKKLKEESNFKLDEIVMKKFASTDDKVRAINRIKDSLLAFVVQNIGNKTIGSRKKDLLTGDNSIANQIKAIQDNEEHLLNQNYVITNLVPITNTDSAQSIYLFDANDTTTLRANNLTQGFYELYNANSALAINLVEVSLLQSGFHNSKTSIHNIIPAEILIETVGNFYNNPYIDFTDFEKYLVLNNKYNELIVPEASTDNENPDIQYVSSKSEHNYERTRRGNIINKQGNTLKKEDFFEKIADYSSNIEEKIVTPLEVTPADRMENLDFKTCKI
jgi:hypothetical protein